MALDTIDVLNGRFGMMRAIRGNHEDIWQDVQDLGNPFRGDIDTIRADGDERISGVFDTTMMTASEGFSNFLQGVIIPRGTDWIRYLPPTEFLDDLEVRRLTDAISFKVLRELNRSNFYVQMGIALRDLTLIGNCALLVEEDRPRLNPDGTTFGGLTFYAVPMRRVWWMTGKNDRIMYITREFEIPAIDAYSFFDGQPGAECMEILKDNQNSFEMVRYLQHGHMNENGIPGGIQAPADRPWVSQWTTAGDKLNSEIVRVRGEDSSPYICGRWMIVDGEDYGRGRGQIARTDALGISELKRQTYNAAGKAIDPPLMLEDENQHEMDTGPSGLMYIRPPVKLAPQYLQSPPGQFAIANQIGVEDRAQIEAAFMTQAWKQPETEPRSAAETIARQSRDLRQMSMPSNVVDDQLLSPAAAKIVEIMHRGGRLPELDELARRLPQDSEITIEFTSPFFTAQREATLERTRAYVERQALLAESLGRPDLLDRIDLDKVQALEERLANVPAEIFRDEDEVEAIREARAAEQIAAQERQAALESTQAASQGARAIRDVAVQAPV